MYANESLSDEKVANFCFMTHGDGSGKQRGWRRGNSWITFLRWIIKVFEKMQLDLEKLDSKYLMLQKKYKASIIKNESLLNEIFCF